MRDKFELYHKVLYFYFQDYLFSIPESERRLFVQSGFFGKLRSIVTSLILSQRRIHSACLSGELDRKNWVFVFGKNNYEATRFLSGGDFIFVSERPRDYKAADRIFILPIKRRLKNYLNFFLLLNRLLKVEGKRVWQVTDAIFASMGWLEAFEELMMKCRPNLVVFSNDHSFVPRSLFFAAKKMGIPTVYIQHASVSKFMPPLEFDLSLLEGTDALRKYQVKGVHGSVSLIGMPRFDNYLQRRRVKAARNVRTIGIAFNTVDSIEKIGGLTRLLLREFSNAKVIIRSHPKDRRNVTEILGFDCGHVTFSNSRIESPFEFILNCDLVVAGETSIHLESRMLNVDSIYFNLSDSSSIYDLYGYIQSGLIKEVKDDTLLVDYIREYIPDNVQPRELIQYYNAAFGSEFEGESAVYARQLIEKML